jgi:chemotaxis signal transduction protein
MHHRDSDSALKKRGRAELYKGIGKMQGKIVLILDCEKLID